MYYLVSLSQGIRRFGPRVFVVLALAVRLSMYLVVFPHSYSRSYFLIVFPVVFPNVFPSRVSNSYFHSLCSSTLMSTQFFVRNIRRYEATDSGSSWQSYLLLGAIVREPNQPLWRHGLGQIVILSFVKWTTAFVDQLCRYNATDPGYVIRWLMFVIPCVREP